jgi:hypothetical protein
MAAEADAEALEGQAGVGVGDDAGDGALRAVRVRRREEVPEDVPQAKRSTLAGAGEQSTCLYRRRAARDCG